MNLDRDKLWQQFRIIDRLGNGYINRDLFESLLDALEPIPPTQGDMMRGKTAEEDARARYPDVVAQSDIDRLVELANAWKQRAEAAEARVKVADEMVKLFLTEAEHCPMLPIGIDPLQREQWTDWITTVLKNCGAHQVSARSKGEPA